MGREVTVLTDEEFSELTNGDELAAEESASMLVTFKKPYVFDRREYTEIDLSALEDMTGADMIAVDRLMGRNGGGVDVLKEVSVEYACYLAARACKLPVEFFTQLPARETMKVKNRVMGFLFGSD